MNRFNASAASSSTPRDAPRASDDAASGGAVSLTDVAALLDHFHQLTTQAYTDSETLLRAYLKTGCDLFGLPVGIVSRIEGSCYTIRAVCAADDALKAGMQFDLADTYCAQVVRTRAVVAHAQADEAIGHPVHVEPKLASYVSAPIWTHGALYGTLNFSSTAPRDRAFSEQERNLIGMMAHGLGRFLERAREEQARRTAEVALQKSKARYRQLVEQAGDILYQADPQGRFTYANSVAVRLTGYSEAALRGMSFLHLVREDYRAKMEAFYAQQVAERVSNTYYEFPMVTRTGDTVWLGQNVQLLWSDGEPTGVQAVARNITERRRADEALRRSEALLDRTNRMAKIGGWEYELATETIFWTGEVYRLHEVPPGGMPSLEEALLFYPEEHRAVLVDAIERAVAKGESYDLELKLVTAKGRRRWVRAIGEAVREAGRTVRLVGTLQDITERKRAEQALHQERQFLNAVLENMRAGVVACDAEGALTFSNRATRELHGFAAGRLPAEAWGERDGLFRADGVTPLRKEETPLHRAFHGERVTGDEIVIERADGSRRVVEVSGQRFRDEGGDALGAVAVLHDVTERKTLEERLYHQAHHDPLTGLPNKKQFAAHCQDALQAHAADGAPYAVLFLDLDRFKSVNDSLGHHAGDELLCEVAARLRGHLRASDLVARLGGDEFGVLLRSARSARDARRLAREMAADLRRPFTLEGCPVHTAGSVGIVHGSARHATLEDVLREADTAMYRAKREGEGPVVFDPAMGETVKTQFHLEADLHRALEQDELRVFFQPILALGDGSLTGFEALVRWQHPERGLLAPGAFIEVAEEAGLVPDVDRWMIRAACGHARRWRERFGDDLLLLLNVNCSHRTFAQSSLLGYVEGVLGEARMPSGQLAIEITERALTGGLEATAQEMRRFRDRGIRLCIDDFGVEYSSLGALQELPVDTLKVDRRFVQRLDGTERGRALVHTIADLARRLDLSLVAEGIETPAQLAAVKALGYAYGQGFLFARPLPPDEAAALIEGLRPWAEHFAAA